MLFSTWKSKMNCLFLPQISALRHLLMCTTGSITIPPTSKAHLTRLSAPIVSAHAAASLLSRCAAALCASAHCVVPLPALAGTHVELKHVERSRLTHMAKVLFRFIFMSFPVTKPCQQV